VVVVDVQVALGLDGEVDAGMPRQEIEHVVEEADPGRNTRRAGAVEIDRDLDIGFLGLALDGGFPHGVALQFAGLLSGTVGSRHLAVGVPPWGRLRRNGRLRQ
jgi:hypothetical protein